MPTWGQLLSQMKAQSVNGTIDLDGVRRSALQSLHTITGRPVVVYASRWMQGGGSPGDTSIGVGDIHALMEVLHGLPGPSLDLFLHSAGGSPMAAEAMVMYLRQKFSDIRVIVPLAAMSAATMLACSSNQIVMGKHSYLGPVDPQLLLETPLGVQSVPAHAIREQFNMAKIAAADPAQFGAWVPMLQQYGPGLLTTCDHVIKLSEDLVREWLTKWMLAGERDVAQRAAQIANQLNEHGTHRVHGRFLSRDIVRGYGLRIIDLEADQAFQDAVLTVFHATMHTFSLNGAVAKIVENHLGRSYIVARAVQPPQSGADAAPPRIQPRPPPAPPAGPRPPRLVDVAQRLARTLFK